MQELRIDLGQLIERVDYRCHWGFCGWTVRMQIVLRILQPKRSGISWAVMVLSGVYHKRFAHVMKILPIVLHKDLQVESVSFCRTTGTGCLESRNIM